MRKLHAVDAPQIDARGVELTSFCGHCGMPPVGIENPASRVCGHCGLGLVLQASSDLAPRAALLVLTD